MVYRFGAFEVDLNRFELRKGGAVVPAEPQVFALLALLVTHHDRMVSKDEIHDRIWNGRIVSDAALNSRIRSVRQAVEDDGTTQRVIRTVRGSGFRFVADVTTDSTGPQTAMPADGTQEPVGSRQESAVAGDDAPPRRAVVSRPIVAVLPFENLSGDSDQEYFSDAVAGDIITALSKHRWLSVVARNTTFGYKGRQPGIRQLTDELGVNYVVEGSVRRAGNRIRVTAQLVDAVSGIQIWSDRYDRELADVFAVQDEITERITARLEPEIGTAERHKVAASGSRDLHAWEFYHLGVAQFFKFTPEGNREAQRLLARSRELDPNFGEAHAWWAYAVVLGMVYWDTEPAAPLLDQALAAAQRALEIDDRNAVFYALKARVQLARREYRSAVAENEVAISLNPTLAAAYCGLGDSLAYEGRYDEAIKRFEKAIELSPNDPQRWAFLTYGALALIFKRDFETALKWADRASVIPNCQYWTTAHRGVALAHLGRSREARKVVRTLLKENPDFSIVFARRKLFYLKRPEQLKLYLDGLVLAGVK
ncbi:MAG TPA: winged helix-turn-helix domain-containing protein [Methylomirabilota bacterium]|nr:winged helix-turn-helix domain-containing protein [Methylomirabilota bacterium]